MHLFGQVRGLGEREVEVGVVGRVEGIAAFAAGMAVGAIPALSRCRARRSRHVQQVDAAGAVMRIADDVEASKVLAAAVVIVLKEITDRIGLAGGEVEHAVDAPIR